ncbi:imm11 family protein [Pyxidicoccus sp. 3LFB2]
MSKRYFRLSDDLSVPNRWDLGHPEDSQGQELADPWQFTDGRPLRVEERLRIPVRGAGRRLDFSHASFSTPIIHARLAPLFAQQAPGDVQLIPVDVTGQPEQYCILVATRLIRCIDDQRSTEVVYWTPEDERPEKVGEYRDVYEMRIDPTRVGDARVFRTWGWPIALIVSEDLKAALEREEATGVRFTEV